MQKTLSTLGNGIPLYGQRLTEVYRLVREMGGFVRFAPLPGGALETRVFLPV